MGLHEVNMLVLLPGQSCPSDDDRDEIEERDEQVEDADDAEDAEDDLSRLW